MGETTAIEWCHHTFNPWVGCTKVHAGCANCYAEAVDRRFPHDPNGPHWGAGVPRRVTSEANWKNPASWARKAAKAGERRRVFCASLADVLDAEAPKDAQARLWDLIAETARLPGPRCKANRDGDCSGPGCPQLRDGEPARSGRHCPLDSACEDDDGFETFKPVFGLDWLILTKRPERWQVIPPEIRQYIWLGTSISDQPTADVWVPELLAAQGFAKLFLSVEPLIAPLNLSSWLIPNAERTARRDAAYWKFTRQARAKPPSVADPGAYAPSLDWVIVGGESGHGARPCAEEWVREVVSQCRAAAVPCFVKQLGAYQVSEERTAPADSMSDPARLKRTDYAPNGEVWAWRAGTADKKGGDPAEWSPELRVRQFPTAGVARATP